MLAWISKLFSWRSPSWVTPGEANMSPAERAFVEESAEDRDTDQIVRAQIGGFDPDTLLGFPDSGRHD
jgi:hypothetical protein